MIVTLAGHVDHGKTSLVRALTGVNTDRLQDEKARGLTIDLGFAYIDSASSRIGFVDVPGHHRFIHNMVAGVASNQFALLVVAADDGPMPQTREHLNILSLTGVRDGVIALTKTDRVSAERLEAASEDIHAMTSGTFLEGAPIVRTSTENGSGVDYLASELQRAALEHQVTVSQSEQFRMAIDRTFTIRGSGLVVTGTVHSGTVAVGNSCALYPATTSVRVRSIHAQDQEAQSATVGDRAAINLTGIDLQDIKRGDWLAAEQLSTTRNVTARLSVLADFPRALKHWSPVHIYHATSHSTGRLALLQAGLIEPGADGLVDVVCDTPLLARHGDTLIFRDQSLDRTLGGGKVIHIEDAPAKRRAPRRLAQLACFEAANPRAAFDALIELTPVDLSSFCQTWGIEQTAPAAWIHERGDQHIGALAVSAATWEKLLDTIVTQLRESHRANPDLPGLKGNELAATGTDATLIEDAIAQLQRAGTVHIEDGFIQLPEHRQQLAPELKNVLDRVMKPLDELQPPSTGDLSKRLNIPLGQLGSALTQIANQGHLKKVTDQRYFLPARWDELNRIVTKLAEAGPFNVRQFRDAANIGRNVAIDILEHLDRRGITQRQGDTRILRSRTN